MSVQPLLQPLAAILAQAQDLVVLAQAQQWDDLNQQVQAYEQAMTVLADSSLWQAIDAAHLNEEARALVQALDEINRALDDYTHAAQEEVASELRQLNQSGKALDAYGR